MVDSKSPDITNNYFHLYVSMNIIISDVPWNINNFMMKFILKSSYHIDILVLAQSQSWITYTQTGFKILNSLQ